MHLLARCLFDVNWIRGLVGLRPGVSRAGLLEPSGSMHAPRGRAFEVHASQQRNIEHKEGDKFYFSPEGYMLAHKGSKKVCPYLMPAMARMMALIQERIYEGL